MICGLAEVPRSIETEPPWPGDGPRAATACVPECACAPDANTNDAATTAIAKVALAMHQHVFKPRSGTIEIRLQVLARLFKEAIIAHFVTG